MPRNPLAATPASPTAPTPAGSPGHRHRPAVHPERHLVRQRRPLHGVGHPGQRNHELRRRSAQRRRGTPRSADVLKQADTGLSAIFVPFKRRLRGRRQLHEPAHCAHGRRRGILDRRRALHADRREQQLPGGELRLCQRLPGRGTERGGQHRRRENLDSPSLPAVIVRVTGLACPTASQCNGVAMGFAAPWTITLSA